MVTAFSVNTVWCGCSLVVLRVVENNSSCPAGRTNYTTCTWSLTFILEDNRRHVDGTLCKVGYDETDRGRQESALPRHNKTTDRQDADWWNRKRLGPLHYDAVPEMGEEGLGMDTRTCSHLFMCRMVRLPVLMLLMTTEVGRTHWACSETRDTSMWNFWKSSKIKLKTGNCLHLLYSSK